VARLPEPSTSSSARATASPCLGGAIIGSGRFGAIGLLMSTIGRRSVLHQAIEGVERGLSEADLNVRFCHVSDEDLSREEYLRQLPSKLAVDGLLVNYTHQFPPALAYILDKYNIPSIWMNVKRDHDCVHPDDAGAGDIAVSYLAGLGHRRIGYASYSVTDGGHYSVNDRRDGYVTAMQNAGLAPQVIEWPLHSDNTSRDQRLVAWLTGDDRPTAVFTHSYAEAVAVYVAAVQAGLNVPRDLSVLTIMTQSEGSMGVEFDSVRVPSNDVGKRAVELLEKKIRRPDVQLPTETISMQLDQSGLGRSCASPSTSATGKT